MRPHRFPLFVLALGALVVLGPLAITRVHADEVTIPESHTYHLGESTITERPQCIECHTDDTGVALKPIGVFNHSSSFLRRHRFYASQSDKMCRACHRTTFCTDCHAHKEELKPSRKHFASPERWLPHRGDYLTQHKIDGMIDPARCFRCHGRQNNQLCQRCHKP